MNRLQLRLLGILLLLCVPIGCRGNGGSGSAEPEAKVRLFKVLRLYTAYQERTKKAPASEQALRDFGRKLSAKERDEYLIGDDLDSIFTSPRDGQKFHVVYNLKLDPAGPTRAMVWETIGVSGKRLVALTMGYVEEYDEVTFMEYKK